MTDYGHELRFGSFLTPGATDPEVVVGLALASEAAGLDLVTFQDHPYQPGYLDTWTLMSYVAARTTSITIAANVLNLPLRPPAVVARSVASLDLLSRGRVELGLGAGAFWDAIEAMGGRRLAPGQAVQALAEAIAVIRGIWAVGDRHVLHAGGDYHHVEGAKRGPAPAHDVEIWLGAYRSRMLALTGRSADGWLPSLGYLGPGDLAEGNRLIDRSALEAGRDPVEVRRLLNVNGRFAAVRGGLLAGPVDQWVEELAGLALVEGISTFILGADDATDLQRFALEVAPAVRELVESERSGPPRPGDGASAGGGVAAVPAAVGRPTSAEAGGAAGVPVAAMLGVTATTYDAPRRSRTSWWDEATRPSSSPPAPGTTYTAGGRAIAQHLVDVHDGLRGELAQVQDIVDQVRAGTLDVAAARSSINEMTMRQNDWTLGAYCASYCRTVTQHHGLEDAQIFPYLRRADAALVPVIDRLAAEHVVIHEVLEDVDAALVRFIGAPDDFTELQDAVDLLTDSLLSHLSYEEREITEPIARYGFYPGQV